MSSLANKVALITGGSAGLGAATARALAALQMRVVINYSSNEKRAQKTLDELHQISSGHSGTNPPDKSKKQHILLKADVSSRTEIDKLVDVAVSEMGQVDVVFSNHGWTKATTFGDLSDNIVDEDWDKCFNMNVKSHLYLMEASRKHLEKTVGTFIMTSTVAGVIPAGSSLAYAVTKAAQIHLMKCLAVIASPKIRVNCVSPGMMITDWSLSFPEARREATRKSTKLCRLATVEDVAQQVCCFAMSQSVTGANAIIDAGSSL
ncbi:hypothetical protein LTR96_002937 [Exophiala xenobiotica]|nr:hypothetical protein LTR92_005195 [Exophiala xenobiotica]KAK5273305.1 hypothetical protein LTR96_002937 [Exophiala xenobiotica]KAK5341022.1 hypothetical protein LTR98_001814 [Exophiala xenobiotica]KAK5443571.1 hypothetical protein LTR18_004832 [Exophiala xenobiotica]